MKAPVSPSCSPRRWNLYLDLATLKGALNHLEFVRFREEEVAGRKVVICSYMLSMDEIWNTPLGVEACGATFDAESGELVSLPFEKFFNVNEKAHTRAALVEADMANGFYVTEKLDGSMLTPIMTNSGPVLKTRKSAFSDVAAAANMHATKNVLDLCTAMCEFDFTPIFEYMTPDNKIVLDYGEEPRFVLLAARNMQSGHYMSYEALLGFGVQFDVPVVNKVPVNSLQELLDKVETEEGIEGWVICTGKTRYKIKTRWYCDRHNLVDLRYRDVAKHVLNDTLDDLMPNIRVAGGEEAVKKVEEVKLLVRIELAVITNTVLKGIGLAIRIENLGERARYVIDNFHPYQKPILAIARHPEREYDIEAWVIDFYRRTRLSTWSLRSVVNANFGQEDAE